MSRIKKIRLVLLAVLIVVSLFFGGCMKSTHLPERSSGYLPGTLRLLLEWTLRSTGEGFTDVVWTGNDFATVGSNQVYMSHDGVIWMGHAVQTSGTKYYLESIAWSGTQFVVVGDHGVIFTSPDGATWTIQNSGTTKHLMKVVWVSGINKFIAVGASGVILTSGDGITWNSEVYGPGNNLFSIACSATNCVIVGSGGIILTSPDGSSWTKQNSGTKEYLFDIAWSGSMFMAVGYNGTIVSSGDGIAWNKLNSGSYDTFRGVAYSGSRFVIAVDTGYLSGGIISSPDGVVWTQGLALNSMSKIVWTGSQFLAVGSNSTVARSSDGITWTVLLKGPQAILYDVA